MLRKQINISNIKKKNKNIGKVLLCTILNYRLHFWACEICVLWRGILILLVSGYVLFHKSFVGFYKNKAFKEKQEDIIESTY